MKLKTIYICSKCNAQASRWAGQCSNCKAWNTLVEDVVDVKAEKTRSVGKAQEIHQLAYQDFEEKRIKTGISEFDRVLGGGVMQNAINLVVGDPGVGKSTLVLQAASKLSQKLKILYVSGEESVQQVSARAKRLKAKSENLLFINEVNLENILVTIDDIQPDMLVLDSLQVVTSAEINSLSGSISQVRYIAEKMMQVAKQKGIPVFVIGHVNKGGELAGPMTLAHLVDAVLYLEGEKYQQFKMLRCVKNRFGSVDEVGVFEMTGNGFIEVKNPSAAFLEGRQKNALGSIVVPSMEGSRSFLVEIQALTTYTNFGYPKRTASGVDLNRLNLMIAVLNKYASMKLDSQDVFVNVIGGFKINEPAVDLGICLAIASSKQKKPIQSDLVAIGEVGLSGEIRSVNFLEKRIKEAEKLGFKKVILPKTSKVPKTKMETVFVRNVVEAVAAI